ncbi:hypothetical protein [Pseudomonas sp.]|uniref:hypothetical protein n=1 Tax=Pseudomonas sp. TaxID=306 RepID=UPI003BB52DF3
MALWESKYADRPPFALNKFLGEVAATTARKLERAKLYRELAGALTGPLSALLPAPKPLLLSWRQRLGMVVRQVEARHLAFAPRKLL